MIAATLRSAHIQGGRNYIQSLAVRSRMEVKYGKD